MMKCRGLILLFSLLSLSGIAQEYLFPLNRDMNVRIGSFLAGDRSGFHTSIKPYTNADLRKIMPLDSIQAPITGSGKFYSTWVGRKLRKEHLLLVNEDDILLAVDPVFNLQLGRDIDNDRNLYVNTRGVQVSANVKDKFFFYSGFRENQARYIRYVDQAIIRDTVVPGQGKVKFLKDEAYDFSQSYGGIAYTLNKHFDFLLAHDKNFIGEGYRSLLLSDNSYNYPFLRLNMTFWKFRYSVYYAVLQDLKSTHDYNVGYFKKYSTTHYLDINIGKKNKISLGVFETVLWKASDSRGYELHYLNPMLFLRPVENSLDSPDNALLGLNVRWKVNSRNIVYGQLMLDEFLLEEVKAGDGWWGNKQGFQLGFHSMNIAGIKNLNIQSELNYVRPFTYQHRSNSQNYTHYNQALAHPLGANFIESISFVNFRIHNFFMELKVQMAKGGSDTAGVNLGNDIFKSYETRITEHGHRMYQGRTYTLNTLELRVNYLVNPVTNFNVIAGGGVREFKTDLNTASAPYVFFGLRTNLENFYFDF